MITVQNISKFFGTRQALKDISFDIQKGEIIGFLGPNGAGKTTLMRILTGYFLPTRGKAAICGLDAWSHQIAIKEKIGYLPEVPPLYPEMTVTEYLQFAARIKGIESKDITEKIRTTLKQCFIEDVKNQVIATLSKGYRQRVGIAQAVIHDPEILILDEPTSGLDPRQIIQVRNLIRNLETKRTVILSTHILSEIEQIARKVIVIDRGQIVANQTMEELLIDPMTHQSRTLEQAFLRLTKSS